MIIVKLMGGLGNQMFQYAAGRSLARRYDTELKFDASFWETEHTDCTPRRLELQHLNLKLVLATPIEIAELTGRGSPLTRGLALFRQLCGISKPRGKVYCESVYHYAPQYKVMSDNAYLEGYWQSPLYFTGIEAILRDELRVTTPIDEKNRDILELIRSCNSISVHIRRGDYVSNSKAAQVHGTCGIDYYRQAVARMVNLEDHPSFFVFSDDIEWAREHLGFIPGAIFVASNGVHRGVDDLRLLSNCRHHIIANSSFSWWGAWLSAGPGKKVIAPARWYLRNDIDTSNLCPASWFRI